jgi:adenine-specific DNA-methyltransferase
MPTNLDKFKTLLEEIFMFDQADLDFGIYRIINAKRDEIRRFLNNDLLPQVRQTLSQVESGDRAGIKAELDKAVEASRTAGIDPQQSPRVKELQAQYVVTTDMAQIENEVFSDLSNFFRRYYNEGDFLSLRRYKDGVYAIPYNGEEVKFHWANADQFYIKSSEYFHDYAFKLPDGRLVHFAIAKADTEINNNRPAAGQERRFLLLENGSLAEESGELFIRFEYRPDSGRRKQSEINSVTAQQIMAMPGFDSWQHALGQLKPTEKSADRTLLDKYLADYTARNTFDYFIHRNLGEFLHREFDFFVKNEVMHLDDIDSEAAHKVEEYLGRIKASRQIAHKIIDFLAQLEDFQKRLWLKKKFVVETHYCITLDRVPEALFPEIVANDAQREEWVRLFSIDEIAGDPLQLNPGYSVPLKAEFLASNHFLPLDTRFFSEEFVTRLLSSIYDLDDQMSGILIHSDNFQALNLLQERYKEQVKCIYIDPPYNTASSPILYKNDYRHSSWMTMMFDRLTLLKPTLAADGAIFVSIDKTERTPLEHAMNEVFGSDNRIEELVWSMNTNNSQAPNYSTNHEYVEVYSKDRKAVEQDKDMFREPKPGFEEVMALVARINPSYPSISEIESKVRDLYQHHRIEFREEIEARGTDWEDEKGNDPWRGLFNYDRAEYRDANGAYVPESDAQARKASIWIWREDNISMPATKQAPSTLDPTHPNWRFYKPKHPIVGKSCSHPKSGWKFAYQDDLSSPDRKSFLSLDRDYRIAWGVDEKKVPQLKRFLHEVETNVGKSVFQDYSDGEKQTSAMFGKSGMFLAPKHARFVSRFIQHAAKKSSTVLDCFGGSGSTAHAVISLNREDHGNRKYVLVEVAEYFDTVLKPRILKAVYSQDWRGGKPISRDGISHFIKYIRLESYEDSLNNLNIVRTPDQQELITQEAGLREQYLLKYMLDMETSASASLLNLTWFEDPFNYKLYISKGSVRETRQVNVDLVETFNLLLGLRVKHIDAIRGYRVVQGIDTQGNRVLIIWRNTHDKSNEDLDDFFVKQKYNTKDNEFDLVYVNGDNNLDNLRRKDETWKVRLIEYDFKRLMFEGAEK